MAIARMPLLLCVGFALIGCSFLRPPPRDWAGQDCWLAEVTRVYQLDEAAVNKCLPKDVTLNTVAEYRDAPDNKQPILVRDKLAAVQAYCAGNGKLYSGSGKEIRFWLCTKGKQDEQAEVRAHLGEDFTMIDVEFQPEKSTQP